MDGRGARRAGAPAGRAGGRGARSPTRTARSRSRPCSPYPGMAITLGHDSFTTDAGGKAGCRSVTRPTGAADGQQRPRLVVPSRAKVSAVRRPDGGRSASTASSATIDGGRAAPLPVPAALRRSSAASRSQARTSRATRSRAATARSSPCADDGPVMLKASRVVRSAAALVSKQIDWSLEQRDGRRHERRQRARSSASTRARLHGRMPVKLLFFRARFSARTRSSARPSGAAVLVDLSEGRVEALRARRNGELALTALPRGDYDGRRRRAGLRTRAARRRSPATRKSS